MSETIKNKNSKKVRKTQKMTLERLRSFKGFENYSETKAKRIIRELEQYAKVIVQHIMTRS